MAEARARNARFSGLSRAASILYGLAGRAHRRFRRRRLAGEGRPACAVVSVGGVTVGGAGKTPVAARLAHALSQRNHRVVLASRGYGGRNRESVTLVSDGEKIRSTVEEAGDEALLLASHAPGVPVLVGRDRRRVGHHAVAAFDADIVVLDDGFQHHGVARDFDLVCIDRVAGIGNGRVLPAGPLREPLSALKHADAICVVGNEGESPGAEGDPELLALLTPHLAGEAIVVRAGRRAIDLAPLGQSRGCALDSLQGEAVGLIAGIARPGSLRRSLEALGARVVAERRFPDHHPYGPRDLADLGAREGESGLRWVMTEKDALKILPDWVGPNRVDVLRIEARFDDEAALLDAIEEALVRAGRLRTEPRA